jgi:NAD(P)-dependent dehydrogenase (short-subunit alcohol dehydrogenase family)
MAFNIDLTGKVALITGGSYGLGLVWAEALAEAGASLALTARSKDLLEANAAAFAARGIKATAHPGDVTKEEDVRRVVADTLAAHGRIDILVNNAGVTDSTGKPSENVSIEDFRHDVEVDLIGVFAFAQTVGRHMLERGSGSIVNISSMLGMGASEYVNPSYHASKAGVINLTRQLAVEWADRGVRVNAISPGYFMSEMIREALELTGMRIWIEGRTPMRRLGEHDELKGALVFLASDMSSYVTGQNLAVDGGTSSVMGSNQLKVPHLQWTRPGPIAKEKLFQGIAELPPEILREGIPGFHFPIEE